MKALTARQQEVFDLIRDHISQTGTVSYTHLTLPTTPYV